MSPPAGKVKLNCLNCGAVYALDPAKVPPGRASLKCLSCGSQIPLSEDKLARDPAPDGGDNPPPGRGSGRGALDAPALEFSGLGRGEGVLARGAGESAFGGWLALYGDVMSILLVFFVLLFAMSTLDPGKFQAVLGAVSQSLGGRIQYVALPPEIPLEKAEALLNKVQLESYAFKALQSQLQGLIYRDNLQAKVLLQDEKGGLVLIAQDVTMFDSGQADIKPEIKPFLLSVGRMLEGTNNDVVIEGHTDDVPINTSQFASNWELSVTRATNVLHFLLDHSNLSPRRISAAGYAFYRPRWSFDGAEAGKNRRIEIVIKKVYDAGLFKDLVDRARTSQPPAKAAP
ncbi:MAG: zinc-ribbon domain-containing protein [Deltaproteobacteria bacterium]|nr:zinc-ribbon domain-containing protein [Deltaproteobacteria bacterium]